MMDAHEAGSIEERIGRLERQNARLARESRRWKGVLAAVASCGAVALIAGAVQDAGPMTVSQLNVVGPKGRVRITLGVSEAGDAQFDLFDPDGDLRARLVTDGQGVRTSLQIRDAKDAPRIDLGVGAPEAPASLSIDGQPH